MNTILAPRQKEREGMRAIQRQRDNSQVGDVYFSADVETDGPIPGPYSMLSFALVPAGSFDGKRFVHPTGFAENFYRELRPISEDFQPEALRVNGIDRERLRTQGETPERAMLEAYDWTNKIAGNAKPVLVAYPLSFDWAWLYWYFVRFSSKGSPFNHSLCFDMKTAYAVKASVPISEAGRSKILPQLLPDRRHTHHALDDAIEQAEIFGNLFEWEGSRGRTP
jgi:DNA polymerase III epsilon subunit-like protein